MKMQIRPLYFVKKYCNISYVPGTLQSSNTNSHVFDPRIPSLSNFGEVLKPGIPLTRKARHLLLNMYIEK